MFRRHARTIAAVVLCFFTWTSGGVFTVAHAAQDALKKGKALEQQKSPEGSEERFSRLTEELTVLLADPKVDVEEKKQRLVSGRTEIDALDKEIKKQFTETEKRLKDANLPAEILERHYRFVKHYEDNFAEFMGNVERVEKAKDKMQAEAEIEKMRSHLEKVKAPSRHQPLDPNNLPHRQPKVIKREPRMKKEEFERDLKKDKQAWRNEKRIIVASTGSLTGLLPSDDLAETIEVQFTPEIKAKAQELENNPVKIYEWVRNNIRFVPTWGSIQGAQMTLLTRQGNAFDTSSLLIALLRAAGIHARYVTGTIELPIDKAMNWAGGFTDPIAALTFIASGGVPIKAGIAGGNITKAQLEHVWVEAFLPYGNYRGTMRDQSTSTWIPLDASFKQYSIVTGFDITAAVPFNQDQYLSQLTNLNSLHYYESQIQTHLDGTKPGESIVDAKGRREIAVEKFKFLPSTLPYKTIVVASKVSAISAISRAKITFRMSLSNDGISDAFYSAPAPELAGRRITLSYCPATTADEALVASFGGFMFDVPAYMLQVKPELKIEGKVVLTGETTTLGNEQYLTMAFGKPNSVGEVTKKMIVAGGYYAVGVDGAGITEGSLGKRNGALRDSIMTLPAENFSNDDLIGEHLNLLAMTYFFANDKLYSSTANLYNVAQMRTLSGNFVSIIPAVTYFFSIPRRVTPSNLEMDVKMDRIIVVARDGNLESEKAFMDVAGLASSFNEHYIFEAIDGYASVSTVKALQTANQNGTNVFKINAANLEQTVPLLQVSQEVVEDIRASVKAGYEITIPQKNVQINDWNGVGYIIKDPNTGSGAYMISGGLAGGGTIRNTDAYMIAQLQKEPFGWVKDRVDPQTRNTIVTAANLEIGDEIVGAAEERAEDHATYEEIGRCTGLVINSYKAAGIDLKKIIAPGNPSNASELYLFVKNNFWVGSGEPVIGDIIFFKETYNRLASLRRPGDDNVSHVAVVSDVTDGKITGMIHAANPKRNVVEDSFPSGIHSNSYWGPKLLGLGRPR